MAGGAYAQQNLNSFTISRFLFTRTPHKQAGGVGTMEGLWRGYSLLCPKDTIC